MRLNNKIKTIHIVANTALGPYLSGGDRIWIELSRKWAEMGIKIKVYVWEEGMAMAQRNDLNHKNIEFILWSAKKFKKFGFAFNYFARTVKGILNALKIKKRSVHGEIIYSSSDFWPDSIPAFLMRKKLKNAKWVAGFYLFAPNPLKGFRGNYGTKWHFPKIKELLYFFHQKPIYFLVKKYADMIFVTGEEDKKRILNDGFRKKIVMVKGGVDTETPKKYFQKNSEKIQKEYDACFVGRFHPQKGVLELIDIWDEVLKLKQQARLAIIGADSESYKKMVVEKIRKLGLQNNIDLLGYLNGFDKYKIFLKSRMILHPAIYDSGGMAACEGMAWGLPAIGFDLVSLKTYYPKGMLKAKIGDMKDFSKNIVELMDNQNLYLKIKKDALTLANSWSWRKRAEITISHLESLIK